MEPNPVVRADPPEIKMKVKACVKEHKNKAAIT